MRDVLGDAAPPAEVIDNDGKVWAFAPPVQRQKVVYCDLIAKHHEAATANSLRERGLLGAVNSTLAKLYAMKEDGAYEPGGQVWTDYCLGDMSSIGIKIWIQSLLLPNHPKVTYDDVKKLVHGNSEAVKSVMKLVVPPFFEWVEAGIDLTPENSAKFKVAVANLMAKVMKE